MRGEWVDRGRVNTAHAGIDGTVFEHGGERYFAYSPYIGPDSGLAIARMSDPWTLTGPESVIAMPDKVWEKPCGRQIIDGPEFLRGQKGDLRSDERRVGQECGHTCRSRWSPHNINKNKIY